MCIYLFMHRELVIGKVEECAVQVVWSCRASLGCLRSSDQHTSLPSPRSLFWCRHLMAHHGRAVIYNYIYITILTMVAWVSLFWCTCNLLKSYPCTMKAIFYTVFWLLHNVSIFSNVLVQLVDVGCVRSWRHTSSIQYCKQPCWSGCHRICSIQNLYGEIRRVVQDEDQEWLRSVGLGPQAVRFADSKVAYNVLQESI